MLKINKLTVSIDSNIILNECSLHIKKGKVHILMGPNGSGKSSFVQTLMGHPAYEVVSGNVNFEGQNLFDFPVHERSKRGLYLSMQQPKEIAGLQVLSFLKEIYALHRSVVVSLDDFLATVHPLLTLVGLPESILYRCVNDGFSGGEKKRFELLQMMLLKPKVTMLDEIDSGVDIDGLKLIAQGLKTYQEQNPESSIILVTHYRRILQYLQPDEVHVMVQGDIVESGSLDIIDRIENKGYEQYAKRSE